MGRNGLRKWKQSNCQGWHSSPESGKFQGYVKRSEEERRVEQLEDMRGNGICVSPQLQTRKSLDMSYKFAPHRLPQQRSYDGKGGVDSALTRWSEKMEWLIDIVVVAEIKRHVGLKYLDQVSESEKLENEFWNHKMVGANHAAYTDRFHDLTKLVPHLVTPESSRIKRYIAGLALEIRGILRGIVGGNLNRHPAARKPNPNHTIQNAITGESGILTDESSQLWYLDRKGLMDKWK
ncbi:hypothetical protein Tco_1246235 [Tanacetum coccineum]